MRNNVKVILAVVLGIGAITSVIHGMTAPSPKRGRAAGPPAAVSQAQGSVSGEAAAPVKRLAVRTQFKAWRRHPFVLPERAGGSTMLTLSGIFSKGNIYKAMIGDTIVKKGDKVGSNTVVDVQKDKVILNDGVKNFELKLEK